MESDQQQFVMTPSFLPWKVRKELKPWEAAYLIAGKLPNRSMGWVHVSAWEELLSEAIEKKEIEQWDEKILVNDLREWLKTKGVFPGFFFPDQQNEADLSQQMPFMDPVHEFYSEELALAVKTWLALFGEGGEYQQNRAVKEQIKASLKGKKLSREAVERISTLVNPKKKKNGGSPPSGF